MLLRALQKQSQFPREVSGGQGALQASHSVRAGLKPGPTVTANALRCRREQARVQNKANLQEGESRLTAGQEKGYVKRYGRCVCENKANLPRRACRVPARASVGAGLCARPGQPRGVAPTSRPGCKNKANFHRLRYRVPAGPGYSLLRFPICCLRLTIVSRPPGSGQKKEH